MIDRNKIRLMTKLAIYDKKYGSKDKKMNEYFSGDYVYRRNWWTRLYALIGSIIVLLFFWMHKIVVDGVDVLSLDYKQEASKAILFIILVLAAYTLLGTGQAIKAYSSGQKRLRNYFNMLSRLDRLRDEEEEETEEVSDAGRSTAVKRNGY